IAQLGSVAGIAMKALTVSGKKNECSMASARSNCFCASGEHEVLKCTRPSFLRSPVQLAGSVSAQTDATRSSEAIPPATKLGMDFIAGLPDYASRLGLPSVGSVALGP